jgi:DNA-binding NarL/FixJ family response regulator
MGLTTHEIGDALGISPRTVRAHADCLRERLAVAKQRQIVMAFRAATGVDPISL